MLREMAEVMEMERAELGAAKQIVKAQGLCDALVPALSRKRPMGQMSLQQAELFGRKLLGFMTLVEYFSLPGEARHSGRRQAKSGNSNFFLISITTSRQHSTRN